LEISIFLFRFLTIAIKMANFITFCCYFQMIQKASHFNWRDWLLLRDYLTVSETKLFKDMGPVAGVTGDQ